MARVAAPSAWRGAAL